MTPIPTTSLFRFVDTFDDVVQVVDLRVKEKEGRRRKEGKKMVEGR
jgi:hypothetical protein